MEEKSVISVRQLTKRYQTHCALDALNLEVGKGEVFGIIGMSGAGKTTLMRCLTTLESPTEGEVFLANEPLSKRALKKMGMIFQHFNLFSSRSVLDNVAYPLEIAGVSRGKREARARELLELVGLAAKEKRYPAQLSGGEKQRVAIARALIHHPEVLLCDEATSSLDPRTTRDILDLLSRLNKERGLTIVLITHEMEVIKQICTHVAVLEHGEIVEKGPVAQLFAKPKHPTTQRFLQNISHEIPKDLEVRKENSVLLRLAFTGSTANQPIMSRLIREHQVEVNILLGGMDVLTTETIGNLVVELTGAVGERARARAYLESQGVGCDELD
ncbi:MAG: Methionine import ATP-binding protein MetN 2 [Chlamydiales bacterium]|nr:Methionine import ATP-binding protein MetN 2 [Chlamydiales bacterium]